MLLGSVGRSGCVPPGAPVSDLPRTDPAVYPLKNRESSMKPDSRPPIFHVFLVRPSKYDDEGFVIRYWRAVVPSNSLACLYGLTEDVRQRRVLGEVDLRIHAVDEAVNKMPLDAIVRLNRRAGERVLVCLVGVQTNQFCRAADIALALRQKQVAVMIGGFHTSGMLALFPSGSPEIQQLVDAGVSVIAGEVEHRWADILKDAYEGKLKPIYCFLDDLPDLSDAPRPIKHKQFTAKHVHSNYGTIDCSRGCPFNCSFCTIINVQGRKTRYRSPECIAETIRQAYRDSGVNLYFFTDDNFARNPAWEEIFDRLIALREDEGTAIEFVIQADIPSHNIPGFIDKAVRAGCCTVFIGMESLNPRETLRPWARPRTGCGNTAQPLRPGTNARVTTLVGYIIGFPVRYRGKRQARRPPAGEGGAARSGQLLHDGASARLRGITRRMIVDGAPMDADYNRFDCAHETTLASASERRGVDPDVCRGMADDSTASGT